MNSTNCNRCASVILVSRVTHFLLTRVPVLLMLLAATLSSQAVGQTLTTLYNFGAVRGDGEAPTGGVIVDKNGNLFGTTGVGGVQASNGTVYELSPPAVLGDPWVEIILHRFQGNPDGKNPESRLHMTAKGALVATARFGGTNDQGAAYTLTPPTGQGSWKEKILYNYGSLPNDVVAPNQGLFQAPEGYYGADNGGAQLLGAFYLLTPATGGGTWTQNILYSFKSAPDATSPDGDLIRDSKGNFYGVGAQGGANNLGAVFELSPPSVQGGSWTENVLFSFNGTDGTLPAGPLLLGAGGVLYGTTNGGGSSGAGRYFS
ncbi:MAG: hypothetical protein H0X25_01795 [Acidobacteriales bacterium]|nr:hypothetical protein [Terriglobales bacterium]